MTGYGLNLTAWALYDAAKAMFAAQNHVDYDNAVRRLRDAVLIAERSSDPTDPAMRKAYPGAGNTDTEGARPRRAEQGRVETVLLKDTPATTGGKP